MEKFKLLLKEIIPYLVEIEAEDIDDAKNKAYDALVNGELDTDFTTVIEIEEWSEQFE